MNRRFLIALLGSTALTACAGTSGQTNAQIAQTVVTNAGLIANALTNILPNVQGVPPAVAGAVAVYAQQAVAAAQSLVATMTQAQAQPVIQQIQTAVTAVASALQPYVKPGTQAAIILADVQVLVPVLLLAVGLSMSATQPTSAPADPAASQTRLQALPNRA